jgi:hypothetical protein
MQLHRDDHFMMILHSTDTTMTTYLKLFDDYDEAFGHMSAKNQTSCQALYVLIDGPQDDFAVVDIATAIDMGALYEWSTR